MLNKNENNENRKSKLFVNITVYSEEGKIYRAKNTKFSRAVDEMNEVLRAKIDDGILISVRGVE